MLPSSVAKQNSLAPVEYWRVFRELPFACILFEANDPIFTIVDMNHERERQSNTTREKHIGRSLPAEFPGIPDEYGNTNDEEICQAIRKAIHTGRPTDLKLTYHVKSQLGVKYWHRTYVPVKGASGAVTHLIAITRDVTEEHGETRRAFEAESRLESALAIGKVGSWLWNLGSDTIVANSIMAKMIGVGSAEAEKGLPSAEFKRVIHKDDIKRVEAALKRAVQDRTAFEEEYRICHPSGKVRWVIARGKVQDQSGELLFPGVVMDITERRNLQAQIELARQQDKLNRQAAKILQQRNDELETIGRSKDEFVALASHQLRTPATAVKQYLGMVLQGYVGDISDMQAEMLSKAFESNERQIQIINQILNAARVDTGKLVLALAPVDLRSLVQGIVNDMKSMFDAHAHKLHLVLPKTPVPVQADMGYLRMAIENMVNNAIVYTPNGGKVTLRLTRVGKHCRLVIADTGVGIRKSDLSKLFIKFSRIHNPLSVQAGGTGIGLYLAAEIIRLHDGEMSVDSEINKGTTFAISLPIVQNTT